MVDFSVRYASAYLIYESRAMIVDSKLCLKPFALIKTNVFGQDTEELL